MPIRLAPSSPQGQKSSGVGRGTMVVEGGSGCGRRLSTKLEQKLPKPAGSMITKKCQRVSGIRRGLVSQACAFACRTRHRRVALSATVACTAKCWESLGGHAWVPRGRSTTSRRSVSNREMRRSAIGPPAHRAVQPGATAGVRRPDGDGEKECLHDHPRRTVAC